MKSQKHRKVVTYKDYFRNSSKVKTLLCKKDSLDFRLIEDIDQVPETYLKHLTGTDGLYEVRAGLSSNVYRIFCFFSGEQLVVLMNAFQKKTRKTPKSEITKALKIKEEYEQENK